MPLCNAFQCLNKGVHRFPSNQKRRKLWINALRLKNLKPNSSSRLCSDHFKPDDYHDESKYTGLKHERKYLKKGAVPSSSYSKKEAPSSTTETDRSNIVYSNRNTTCGLDIVKTLERCVNCGIAVSLCNTLGQRLLDNETILSVIQQWLAPQSVNCSDYVCQACWDLALNPCADQKRQLGHRNVCIHCGRSLASRLRHLLHTNTTREANIYNVIKDWIIPRTIQGACHICHNCWVLADRAAVHVVSGREIQPKAQDAPTVSTNDGVTSNQPVSTIVLPEYMRAIETENRCFIEECRRTE